MREDNKVRKNKADNEQVNPKLTFSRKNTHLQFRSIIIRKI